MKYIYMLRGGGDCYKVGVAKSVPSRVAQIQTSNPQLVEIVTAKLVRDATTIEKAVHAYLADHRANGGTEWFQLSHEQVVEVCVLIHRYPDAIEPREINAYEVLDESRRLFNQVDSKLDALIDDTRSEKQPTKAMPSAAHIARKVEDDMLIESALAAFKSAGRVSVSLLQARLKIGYGRAFRVMEDLEQAGFVTPRNGEGRRELAA